MEWMCLTQCSRQGAYRMEGEGVEVLWNARYANLAVQKLRSLHVGFVLILSVFDYILQQQYARMWDDVWAGAMHDASPCIKQCVNGS